MNFCSVTVRDWKTNIKIVIGTLNLFAMIFILPMPVAALEKALVRTRDGSVYQIRFRNINPNSVYNVSNFVDDFSIYDKAGVRELCPGNDESVTWELYTAARVLAKTPRHTSLFDTSALADAVMKTAEEFGIDQQGNVDIIGIVGEIVREMVVDEIKGEVLTLIGPSLNLGIVTINLGTFKIELNASGPPIIVKPTEFLSKLVGIEIEMRRALYAFSRAAAYANTATHLQTFANHKAAALWDVINAGGVVDITGNAFSIQKESVEVSDAIGVFDPLRLRLAAQVYQIYAEYTGEVGTGLAKHEDPIEALLETLASRFSVDIMTEFLSTLSTATDALEKKTALDQLDARLADNIESELHRNINGIYDSAAHDLTSHGFCLPEQNSAVEPADTIPDDMPVVTPISEPNQSPEVSSRINPLNFKVGDGPKCRNLSNYFSDPDGDILIYTSNSSNDHIIVAIIEDNSVKITPVSVGEAKVTVTASDPGGLTETQDFRVTVQAQLETIPSLPVCDRTPQVREEIMKKTGDNNCANVTEDELESIRRLSLLEKDINTLKQGDFDELRGLEKLVLKGNSLETLPEDVFWYLGNLKELSLRNNQFTILVEDSFEHLDSLTYLSLRGNRLTTLQQGAFNDLDTLIELNLSDNQLTTLPAGVFEELFNLNKLTLENNRITILSRDVFLGLSRLTDLELDGNPLQTIEAGAFNGLSSLTKLDFNNYPLQTIEAGAFNGLSSLTKLELGNTHLRTLSKDVFLGLSSLDDLELYENPLHTIEIGAFNGLSNLRYLDLSDAQLSTLSKDVFLDLSNLESLDLDGNSLKTVEVGAFNGLSKLTCLDLCENQLTILRAITFSGLNNLTHLSLDENEFAALPTDIFSGLRALEHLNLSENQLTTLPADIFSGLSELTYLNLSENQLTILPVNVFKGLSNLTNLNLQDNPGAPFTLTLELARTDNTNQAASGPATVKVKLAEGASFEINVSLSVEGGTLSASTATIAKGSTESGTITVTQSGIGPTTVNLGMAPTVPLGYGGIRMAVGSSLVLFTGDQEVKPLYIPEDVNRDGVVNIQDLVFVASFFGQPYKKDADINGDNVVNIADLVLVANALSDSAAAPAAHSQVPDMLTAVNLHQWLTQAQQLNLTDATSQRGILFLENLLTALMPRETSLLPNYPNPFNPETWIPYQLAEPADVSIAIYAADGRLIRTLALGHQLVGIYESRSRASYWDGKNAFGESVASGLYFYTLKAGDFTATRKMLMRK